MEVDGKEFMRNVALEQDKERLRKEQEKLESLKRESVYKEKRTPLEEESAYVDLSLGGLNNTPHQAPIQETDPIEDLRLEPEDPNKTKKKYILLGLALILVFVITILVIRVVSNSDTEQTIENINPEEKELITDKILDKIDSNEEFQKAIEKKDAQKELQQMEDQREKEQSRLDLPDETVSSNTPLLIDKPTKEQNIQKDPLGLDSVPDKKVTAPVVQKRVEPKAVVPTPKKETVKTQNTVTQKKVIVEKKAPAKVVQPTKQSTGKVSGYYVQVGAFTKQPAKKLLDEISKKGFEYAVHPVNVKGTVYNKVIIGPYPTRNIANQKLPEIKQKLKKSGAYILKF